MIVYDSGLKREGHYLRRPIVKSREKRAKTSKNRAKRKKIRLDRNWEVKPVQLTGLTSSLDRVSCDSTESCG